MDAYTLQARKMDDGRRLLTYAPSASALEAPAAMAAATPRFVRFGISFTNMDASLAAKAKLAMIFSASGEVSATAKALLLDAVATTDYYAEQIVGGSVRCGLRKGIGLRIALKADALEGEVALTFAGVAASAALKRAEVQYEVVSIGLTPAIANKLLGNAPFSGPLSEANFGRLQQAINVDLPAFVRDVQSGKQPLQPATFPVGPVAALTADPLVRSRAVIYAMRRIANGFSLKAALKDGERRFDRDLVVLIYAQVAGLRDPTSGALPDDAAVKRASLWFSSNG